MKTVHVRSLSKDLLPEMPGYRHKGLMLYASPFTHVLRGFYFEDSGFDPSAFYVWAFFLPLYVPAHVSFTFGKRLGEGSGKRLNLNTPQLRDELLGYIRRDGLPFLRGVEEPAQVTNAIEQLDSAPDPYRLEAIAYSLAMGQEVAAARQALDCLVKALSTSVSWQMEMMERARLLAAKLTADPQEAKHQLAEWERTTIKNLGLR